MARPLKNPNEIEIKIFKKNQNGCFPFTSISALTFLVIFV